MKQPLKKRIAIFQYDWPMQSFSKDLAILLAQHNFEVDFFYYGVGSREMVNKYELKEYGVNLIEYPNLLSQLRPGKNIFSRIINKLKWQKWLYFSKYSLKPKYDIIDRYMLYRAYKDMKKISYHYAIGIEKKGLIWAGILCEKLKIPFIYYSLELYIEDHPGFAEFGSLLEPERYYHARSKATIIQDEFRAEALFTANKVRKETIYIPVSVLGKPGKLKSSYFQDKFNLSSDKIILLYFGGIAPNRRCQEIVEVGNRLPDNFVTIFHGFGQPEYITYIKSIALTQRVLFSEEQVDEKELGKVISSATIAYALYSNDFANDRLIAFSSQKIALYNKFGIPYLGMNNITFQKLFNEFKCGETINNFDEIPNALTNILNDYSTYSSAAIGAFEKYSNLTYNYKLLNNFLQ